MKRSGNRAGMTLVEVLIAVVIIGMLAGMLIPAVQHVMRMRRTAQAAGRLRAAAQAFEMYRSEQGHWPPDVSRGVVPPGMEDYFDALGIDWFTQETPVGGNWDWELNRLGVQAAIAIAGDRLSRADMERLDRMVDETDRAAGEFNLTSGSFRRHSNDRYFYILQP